MKKFQGLPDRRPSPPLYASDGSRGQEGVPKRMGRRGDPRTSADHRSCPANRPAEILGTESGPVVSATLRRSSAATTYKRGPMRVYPSSVMTSEKAAGSLACAMLRTTLYLRWPGSGAER